MNPISPDDQSDSVRILVPENLRAGTFASMVNINVSQNQTVLDFIMVNQQDLPAGTLVSRVILTRAQAMELAGTLRQILDVSNEVSPE